MDFSSLFENASAYWSKTKSVLSKEDVRHIADKDNGKGRMLGVFTLSYWKRERLIRESDVMIGYAFKTFQFEGELRDKVYPSWVLFSPEKAVNENPKIYEEVTKKLSGLLEEKHPSKEGKKIKRILHDNLAEASYVLLPEEYTNGSLIYLSVVYVRRNVTPDFNLGYQLFLFNQKVSKEILYLPPSYWTKEWAEHYKNGFKE